MLSKGDCRFIGSIVTLEEGAARVQGVHDDKITVVKLDGIIKGKNEEIGSKIAMHIAASNPLAIDREGIDKQIVDKEHKDLCLRKAVIKI